MARVLQLDDGNSKSKKLNTIRGRYEDYPHPKRRIARHHPHRSYRDHAGPWRLRRFRLNQQAIRQRRIRSDTDKRRRHQQLR
jgi:hypothetical protein